MPITHDQLGVDEDIARRILVKARTIAPCLDSFLDGSEEQKNAIAILKGVIAELPSPGEGRVRSLSRNGTSVTLRDISSAFEGDAEVSLASLCAASSARGDIPLGSFPVARPVGRMWQEGEYS